MIFNADMKLRLSQSNKQPHLIPFLCMHGAHSYSVLLFLCCLSLSSFLSFIHSFLPKTPETPLLIIRYQYQYHDKASQKVEKLRFFLKTEERKKYMFILLGKVPQLGQLVQELLQLGVGDLVLQAWNEGFGFLRAVAA